MNPKRALVFVFLLSRLVASRQDQHVIDSVTPLIKNDASKNDLEIFYELAFQYATTHHSLSLEYLEKVLDIAIVHGDSLKIVKANRMRGQILRRLGRQTEAISVLEQILPMARRLNYKIELADIYTTLATTHTFMAHFDVGLQHNFRALDVWRELGDEREIARVLNNIGLVHYKVGNFDKAIEYYLQAIQITEPQNHASLSELVYSNLGLANVSKKNFEEARKWYNKLMMSCSPSCDQKKTWYVEFGLGYIAFHSKDFQTAKERFSKAYEIVRSTEDPLDEAECLFMLGATNLKLKNYSIAESFLSDALNICQQNSYRSLTASTHFQLFELYKVMTLQQKASVHLENYVSLRDSIHSIEVRNRIMVTQTEFEEKESRLTIAHHGELLEKQRAQTQLVVLICIMTILLATALFFILRGKQRANRILDQRVTERTRELEQHKTSLERAYQERSDLLAKTSQSVKSALATQRGLRASMISHVLDPADMKTAEEIEKELASLDAQLANVRKLDQHSGHQQ
jgi:tetratricopeptide (TPR) repeat protein